MAEGTSQPSRVIATWEEQGDELLSRLAALVKYAQKLAFPQLRKGASAPPDQTGWSRFRRIIYALASPLPSTITKNRVFFFWTSLVGWLSCSYFWVGIAQALIEYIFGVPSSPANSEPPLGMQIAAAVFLVLILCWALLAYWRWIEFFRDRRYPITWRVILSLAFVGFTLSSPYWLLDSEYRHLFPAVLQEGSNLMLFLVSYLFFLIPTFTLCYMLTIDLLVMGGWLLRALIEYLQSAHDPFPKELVRRLALEPIPIDQDIDETWRLVDLSEAELTALHRWSASNRESTDKRLLPTAVLFGIMGLFANTAAFSDAIDWVLTWLSKPLLVLIRDDPTLLWSFAGRTFAIAIVGPLIIMFLYTLLLLFRNLVAQSLIMEACIVAEYARSQQTETEQREPRASINDSFWQRLLKLLFPKTP